RPTGPIPRIWSAAARRPTARSTGEATEPLVPQAVGVRIVRCHHPAFVGADRAADIRQRRQHGPGAVKHLHIPHDGEYDVDDRSVVDHNHHDADIHTYGDNRFRNHHHVGRGAQRQFHHRFQHGDVHDSDDSWNTVSVTRGAYAHDAENAALLTQN